MIDRINNYEKELSAEGFPFDLSYLAFYERCRQVSHGMETMLTQINQSGKLRELDRNISTNLWAMRNTIQKFVDQLTR